MWNGLKKIYGGLLFLLLLLSSFAWSEPSPSPKQIAIAWTFELELLLTDISTQISNSRNSDENEKKQIEEQMKRDEEQRILDEQHSKESSEISTEESKVIDQSVTNQSELEKSFAQYEASLIASRIETEIWRGIAIAVIIGTTGYIIGDRLGWW